MTQAKRKRITEADVQRGGIAAIIAERRKAAELVPAEMLDEWHRESLAALWRQLTQMWAALDHNRALLTDKDPRWARYWLGEARARYVYETFELSVRYGHVVCCLNHGVPGVPESVPYAEGIAWYSTITGGRLWLRYCLECSGEVLAQDAAALAAKWESMTDE